jgi:hypothetical protein
MILIAILISLAILVLMVFFVTRPLYKAELVEQEEPANGVELLSVAYRQALSRIHDLEQDRLEGKISDEDYLARRQMLNKEAAELLHQLEADVSARNVIKK